MRHRHGFNLTELVITVAIIGISAAVAIPRFANSAALYRSQAAGKRIVADLARAQTLARTTSAGQTVTFTLASSSYTLPGATNLTGGSSYVVDLTADPYQAKLTSVVFGSSSTISYDRFGQPSSGGSIVLVSGNKTTTVIVDAGTGKGTVQ